MSDSKLMFSEFDQARKEVGRYIQGNIVSKALFVELSCSDLQCYVLSFANKICNATCCPVSMLYHVV